MWTGADDVHAFPIHVPLYNITCSGVYLCEQVQMTYTGFVYMNPKPSPQVMECVCVNRCRWRTHDAMAWSVSVSSARATRLPTKGRTWRRSEEAFGLYRVVEKWSGGGGYGGGGGECLALSGLVVMPDVFCIFVRRYFNWCPHRVTFFMRTTLFH